jgi:hypothetical protein
MQRTWRVSPWVIPSITSTFSLAQSIKEKKNAKKI